MKVEAFCSCGGAIRGRVKSSDPKVIQKVVKLFREIHDLPGCEPSDAKTAKKARARKERQE